MSPNPRPGAATAISRADLGWQDNAACRGEDPELFFAPDVEYARERLEREAKAKTICRGCIARLSCLEWRLRDERQMDGGIWGALDEQERWSLRKRRIRAAAARRRAA